jgi:hypothetical protein
MLTDSHVMLVVAGKGCSVQGILVLAFSDNVPLAKCINHYCWDLDYSCTHTMTCCFPPGWSPGLKTILRFTSNYGNQYVGRWSISGHYEQILNQLGPFAAQWSRWLANTATSQLNVRVGGKQTQCLCLVVHGNRKTGACEKFTQVSSLLH